MDRVVDIDPSFEPQQRVRSNTWPLPRPENFVDKDGDGNGCGDPSGCEPSGKGGLPPDGGVGGGGGGGNGGHLPKKNSSRRNAWGNMSYADLITQAIHSSSEQRLTLSQIYDWMVQNVPYFKDKGDSNSSAGWKNSIRHNLSLHNRFMRVQNEGTGKSSWWMINPEAKPGKAARRRATSMETQKYEKKRGRVKKKVEALRNGLLLPDATPSPSSSVSESLDLYPDSPTTLHGPHAFQLSPDFRPRASSNASSCGRLSPLASLDTDMHDRQVPPMSPIPWGTELDEAGYLPAYGADQLVETLTETMKLDRSGSGSGQPSPTPRLQQQQQQQQQSGGLNGQQQQYGVVDPYADYRSPASGVAFVDGSAVSELSPRRLTDVSSATASAAAAYSIQQQALSPAHSGHSLSPTQGADTPPQSQQQQASPAPVVQQQQQQPVQQRPSEAGLSPHSHSAYSNVSSPSVAFSALTPPGTANQLHPNQHQQHLQHLHLQQQQQQQQQQQVAQPAESACMLRASLSGHCEAMVLSPGSGSSGGTVLQQHQHLHGHHPHHHHPHHHPLHQHHHPNNNNNNNISISHNHHQTSRPSMGQMMGHLLALNNMPTDLDLDGMEALQGGLECDVDKVISDELSVDGNLDFNFSEVAVAVGATTNGMTTATAGGGRHWVH